jgi:hypothetical protein
MLVNIPIILKNLIKFKRPIKYCHNNPSENNMIKSI